MQPAAIICAMFDENVVGDYGVIGSYCYNADNLPQVLINHFNDEDDAFELSSRGYFDSLEANELTDNPPHLLSQKPIHYDDVDEINTEFYEVYIWMSGCWNLLKRHPRLPRASIAFPLIDMFDEHAVPTMQ